MTENPQSGSLEDLERRWGAERSPQLTLHLAETYRRSGDRSRAVEVLVQGLEHHPKHVAARVALGRFLLEDGRIAGAVEALEAVVTEDPSHLVANKLLVSASLELGEFDQARDRLALYSVLNTSDPDVEILERRILDAETGALERAPSSVPSEASSGVTSHLEDAIDDGSAVQPDGNAAREGDPFSTVWVGLDESSYRSALAAEGIFLQARLETVSVEESRDAAETVTLGQLYLDQGHTSEAERIFRAILERDPDNDDARAGLEATLGGAVELTAADLVSADVLAEVGPLERKRLVLERYRDHLRAASARS
ncbi:MAG: tetratricopeptide repeat protein [Acidobacteriota bacterium]|nr:tetratricopeptide repeat protein [Acidobacteriota bacterium]